MAALSIRQKLDPVVRLHILRFVDSERVARRPASKAVRSAGVSVATVWRWRKRLAARGEAGLRPDLHRCGRKSLQELFGISQAEMEAVGWRVALGFSKRSAWRHYLTSDGRDTKLGADYRRTRRIRPRLLTYDEVDETAARVRAASQFDPAI